MYDVFISFKKTDSYGYKTPDAEIAHTLYKALTAAGLKVFFSDVTLTEIGSSDYQMDIDNAIRNSKTMVLVLTNGKYAEEPWIAHEWRNFYELFLRKERSAPNLYTFVKNVDVAKLPLTLSGCQSISYKDGTATVVNTILGALQRPLLPVKKKNKVLPILAAIFACLILFFAGKGLLGDFTQNTPDGQESITPPVTTPEDMITEPTDTQASTEDTRSSEVTPFLPDFTTEAAGTSRETAFQITPGNSYSVTPSGKETFWFTFSSADLPAAYYFFVDNTGLTYTPKLIVYDDDYSRIGQAAFSQPEDFYAFLSKGASRYYFTLEVYKAEAFSFELLECPCDSGYDKNTAVPLALNQPNNLLLELQSSPEWFSFRTNEAPCIYRITLKSCISDMPLNERITVNILQESGQTLDSFDFYPWYEEDYIHAYRDEKSADFVLSPSTTYYLQVVTDSDVGEYRICIDTIEIDAGVDQESAHPLSLGQEVTAELDTSISDWFVVEVPANGNYILESENFNIAGTVTIEVYDENENRLHFQWMQVNNPHSDILRLHNVTKLYLKIDGGDGNGGTYRCCLYPEE